MSASCNAQQLEIIQLLRQELLELDETAPLLLQGDSPWSGCEDLAELLSNLAEAAQLADLPGFEITCRALVQQLRKIAEAQIGLQDKTRALCSHAPRVLIDYLDSIGGDNESGAVNALMTLLVDPAWPEPITDTTLGELGDAFAKLQLQLLDDGPSLPKTVAPSMTSLAIAEDVRRELIDSMLLELPNQVQAFEKSIEDYLASGAFVELTQAQRIAHTLKGSANIVGVIGIANLMHFIEDLLEQGAKRWQSAPDGFAQLLLEASDCLAAQAEYVCGVGPKPQGTQEVMQQVLDWLNELQAPAAESRPERAVLEIAGHEQARDEPQQEPPQQSEVTQFHQAREQDLALAPSPEGERETTAQTPTQPVSAEDEPDEKHFIHLPDQTAQELLRLSGEAQIANTQLTAQLNMLGSSVQLAERYHQKIRQMASELEVIVQTQSALRAAATFAVGDQLDPLEMERYSELYSFSNQLQELTADSYEAVSQITGQITDLNELVYQQKQQHRESQDLLLEMRLIPLATLRSRFQRCVRQASRLTNKAARLEIHGDTVLLDSRVLNRIADPIMHLLRNAVDHGLEASAEARAAAGKPAEGCIELHFNLNGETLTISCIDDGAGLDYDRIRETARARGLLKPGESADEALLKQMIMMPGFSTRATASQTSGRGIGLDAVQSQVRALKGNMVVHAGEQASGARAGTCFKLSVPTSILTAHAVLVEVSNGAHKQKMAIATRNVEQILFAGIGAIERDDEGAYFIYEQQRLALLEFGHLVGFNLNTDDTPKAIIIVKRGDGTRVAVALEAVLASQDMVVKPLNAFTYHPEGVIGATILGDGSVAPVVDLQELQGLNLSTEDYQRLREHREKIATLERAQRAQAPLAVIVDDSLSARRSLALFMTDLGMDVRTAKDGFEAIKILSEKRPALMLVDLEMPRMNGLELAAHVRSRDDTRDVPIIMITSRTTEKHRQLASRAGVNAYLNKPWSDEDLMASIEQQIAL